MFTLFKKECRQHGAFAIAMVCLCFMFQMGYYQQALWFNNTLDTVTFFSLAVLVAALYAGAAAALAYSTEHADNTFLFLRTLPITQGTLAAGKIGWVLCGTGLVLAANIFLAALWGGAYDPQICLALGIAIIEAFVWGLFWSTRCRSQIHALLASYGCVVLTLYVITYLFASRVEAIDMYCEVAPYRLAACGIVGLFALRGTFRWFAYENKPSLFVRLYPESLLLFGYPKTVQSPFLALVHQHMRHASLIYPFGILCFAVWTLGCCYICFWSGNLDHHMRTWWWNMGIVISLVGMVLFWGNIFGADQRNDSYRYLSRLGIHEGTVWWSRMFPAMFFYFPVFVSYFCYYLVNVFGNVNVFSGERNWTAIIVAASAMLTFWLTPMALGAFFSISFRSQMVAMALTGGGVFLPLFWMLFFASWFGSNPLWSTLPIVIALLVASRIRAAYWLRERYTWRSRLIPLCPVFATMLAVCVALPFVRIYSVPYVSWKQIETYLAQAELPKSLQPEKRKELIEHLAKHNTLPPGYERLQSDILSVRPLGSFDHIIRSVVEEGKSRVFEDYTYEECLLAGYVFYHEHAMRSFRNRMVSLMSWDYETTFERFQALLLSSPWERARRERLLRMQIVGMLVDSGSLQDKRAESLRDFCLLSPGMPGGHGFLDWDVHRDMFRGPLGERSLSQNTLQITFNALARWYDDHDNTLPESLDELIDLTDTPAKYLDKIPTHPFSGKMVEYFRNAPPPEGFKDDRFSNAIVVQFLGQGFGQRPLWQQRQDVHDAFIQTGGAYLRLNQFIYLIMENK